MKIEKIAINQAYSIKMKNEYVTNELRLVQMVCKCKWKILKF